MKIGTINLSQEVLLIAEIGNNHEGNIDLAKRLINLAAEAGAHIAKFQTIDPDRLVHQNQLTRLKQLKQFALTRQDHEELALTAQAAGIMFMSTPFYIDAVEWLDDLVPAFKIASGDNNFDPLLQAVAATGKPVVLSTGMSNDSDVDHACSVIRDQWASLQVNPALSLLHCVSAYPAPLSDVNLAAIRSLQKNCDFAGYSDHTLGIEVAVLAVAAGARIVEKHFTIDKNYSDFRDHALSADPDELKRLAERIREVSDLLGSSSKTYRASEIQVACAARRSIVAKRDLSKGHLIRMDDLDWLRPAGGLTPRFTSMLLGRVMKQTISKGDQLTLEMVD